MCSELSGVAHGRCELGLKFEEFTDTCTYVLSTAMISKNNRDLKAQSVIPMKMPVCRIRPFRLRFGGRDLVGSMTAVYPSFSVGQNLIWLRWEVAI